jgi:hypothetical protein
MIMSVNNKSISWRRSCQMASASALAQFSQFYCPRRQAGKSPTLWNGCLKRCLKRLQFAGGDTSNIDKESCAGG